MHDKHGNEIRVRDVVRFHAPEYLPEMHRPGAFVPGGVLPPVAKYGIVVAAYPAAPTCNVNVACPLITNEAHTKQPDVQTLGAQVVLILGTYNAGDLEVVRAGDGRALELGPHAAPAWWTPRYAKAEAGPAIDWDRPAAAPTTPEATTATEEAPPTTA